MDEETKETLLVTGASVLVGFALKELATKSWEKIYNEKPPTINHSEEINWKKVLIWSFVTGTAISSAKLAAKRFVTLKLDSKSD